MGQDSSGLMLSHSMGRCTEDNYQRVLRMSYRKHVRIPRKLYLENCNCTLTIGLASECVRERMREIEWSLEAPKALLSRQLEFQM